MHAQTVGLVSTGLKKNHATDFSIHRRIFALPDRFLQVVAEEGFYASETHGGHARTLEEGEE